MIFKGSMSGSEGSKSDSFGESTEGTFEPENSSDNKKEVEVNPSEPLPNTTHPDIHLPEGKRILALID